MADLNQNLLNEADEQFVESVHKFTEPIRYFKSNDPYYWEVDNIPLKQLEENILFLRDQIANNLSVSGIGRADLSELRPFVNGTDRVVYVNPGRYTSRINDAYGKGINIFNEALRNNYLKSDPNTNYGYATVSDKQTRQFILPVDVLKKIAGDVVENALLDNGLYTFLQHHNSEPDSLGTLDFTTLEDNILALETGINAAPKIKSAIWRAFSSNKGSIGIQNDLQQESVEFTRFWGGAIRTSIVDVQETLSIEVPPFDATDYSNSTEITPATRIDLLFIYSHPVDATSTTIMKSSGGSPTTITSPQLGILKGAGVIGLRQGLGSFAGYENGQDFFDGDTFSNASGNSANFFRSSSNEDADDLTNRIISTVGDQVQTTVGLNGNYSNIPSPEDLLNLTPLLEERLSSDNLALVGQTVLPIAYVIVKRGQPTLVTNDLFDIRPFFRTAELSYNERAGIAAANPPLSFANPAVGKREVQKSILEVRDALQQQINTPILISKPVAAGTIYGGTLWGVEGALLEIYSKQTLESITDEDTALSALKEFHLPNSVDELPVYPGWDVNKKYFGAVAGGRRNERLFSVVRQNGEGKFNFPSTLPDSISQFEESTNGIPTATDIGGGNIFCMTQGALFVKKDIDFNSSLLNDFIDFDVDAKLLSCNLNTGNPQGDRGGESENRHGGHQTGIFVEKRFSQGIPIGFTIYVCLGAPMAHEGAPWLGQAVGGFTGGGFNVDSYFRDSLYFSKVGVLSRELLKLDPATAPNIVGQRSGDPDSSHNIFRGTSLGRNYDGYASNQKPTFLPIMVTYPTVSFVVTGYKEDSTILQVFGSSATGGSEVTVTL